MKRYTLFIGIILVLLALGGGYLYARTRSQATKIVMENERLALPSEKVEDTQGSSALQEEISPAPQEEKSSPEEKRNTPSSPSPTPSPVKPAQEKSKENVNIVDRLVNFGFTAPSRPRTIDTIVLHSSYDALGSNPYSVSGVIDEWRDAGVAPHYMIDRQGTIYRLVEDKNIAYHAGVSKMPDGRTNVNDFSIGVEILNTKDDTYTDAEYKAVNDLIAYLKGKYSIKFVVGHADIAPGRKTDPWNFNWNKVK